MSSRKWWGHSILTKKAWGDSFLSRTTSLWYLYFVHWARTVYLLRWLHVTEIDSRSKGHRVNEMLKPLSWLFFSTSVSMSYWSATVVSKCRKCTYWFKHGVTLWRMSHSGEVSAVKTEKERKRGRSNSSDGHMKGYRAFINLSHRVCTFGTSCVVFSHPWRFTAEVGWRVHYKNIPDGFPAIWFSDVFL